MRQSASALLRGLERSRQDYAPGAATRKRAALRALSRARLQAPGELRRLHEQLCYLRAYPDDPRLLAQVERMLRGFSRRADFRRRRAALADSGIAGTDIHYRFFWPVARRLAARWPRQLEIDWDNVYDEDALARALPLLVTPSEAAWLRTRRPEPRAALDRLRGAATRDAGFYVRRVEALPGDDFTREALFDGIDLALVLRAGRDTPSRTLARWPGSPVVLRAGAPTRARPDLRAALARPPAGARFVGPGLGRAALELAQDAMLTRARDLDAFSYGEPRDVRVIDDGDGLQWLMIGMKPERRAPFRTAYGYLMLRSGVPLGYIQTDSLFGCADVSFNVFPTFRGGEASHLFARTLAMAYAVLGARSFTIEPYQLGHENGEAIASGAWWFYYKLGFRPRAAAVRALVRRELGRMKRDPGYRSSKETLRRLAEDYLVFEPGRARAPSWPRVAELGMRAAARLSATAGADREAAARECATEAMRLLGVRPLSGGGVAARAAWQSWAPIVLQLPGIARWSRADKRALADVIRLKGERRESDYLAAFEAHPKLGAALLRLCRA
jgi:hypothetical protein